MIVNRIEPKKLVGDVAFDRRDADAECGDGGKIAEEIKPFIKK